MNIPEDEPSGFGRRVRRGRPARAKFTLHRLVGTVETCLLGLCALNVALDVKQSYEDGCKRVAFEDLGQKGPTKSVDLSRRSCVSLPMVVDGLIAVAQMAACENGLFRPKGACPTRTDSPSAGSTAGPSGKHRPLSGSFCPSGLVVWRLVNDVALASATLTKRDV